MVFVTACTTETERCMAADMLWSIPQAQAVLVYRDTSARGCIGVHGDACGQHRTLIDASGAEDRLARADAQWHESEAPGRP